MMRSRELLAMAVLGVLISSATLEAQPPGYAKGGDKAMLTAYASGDWTPVVAVFASAASGDRGRTWCTNQFFLGHALFWVKKLPEASAAFDTLFDNADRLNCATHGLLPAWHFYRGLVHKYRGLYKEASSSFAAAASLAPVTLPADFWPGWTFRGILPNKEACYGGLAAADMELARYQEAADTYKQLIELSPGKGLYYSSLGRSLAFLARYDDALAAAKRGLELQPDWWAYGILGYVQAHRNHYDEAIVAYRKALETNVGNSSLRYELGAVLLATDDLVGALEEYSSAAALDRKNARLVATMGFIQCAMGRFDQAMATFDQAISLATVAGAGADKNVAEILGDRSLCARELGDRQRAAQDAERASSIDPDGARSREALGAARLDAGKFDEAIAILSGLKENTPVGTLLLATAYARKGDARRAIDLYAGIPSDELLSKRALRQSARKALLASLHGYGQQKLDEARASESAGRFVEAMAAYGEAVTIADDASVPLIRQRVAILLKGQPYLAELPEDARKRAVRGDLMIKDGAFANALTEYQAALKVAPFAPQLYFNTALIHGQLKNYRAAINAMTVYLQLSPDAPNARAAKDEVVKWEYLLEKDGKK